MSLKLYHIEQDVNTGYDTYSDAIVCTESEEEARKWHPMGKYDYAEATKDDYEKKYDKYGSWCKKEYVKVTYIGEAKEGMEAGIVCASFHAG